MKVATKRKGAPVVGLTAIAVLAAVGVSWICADWTARSAAELNAFLAAQGDIYQAGTRVGWATGARISPADPSTVQFKEISNAHKLVLKIPFEYSGYVLRVAQIRQVHYPDSESGGDKRPARPPDVTLLQVVAKIEGAP